MRSVVYFVPVSQKDPINSVEQKLRRLIKETPLLDCVRTGNSVAVKIHFGEEGNKGFVRPEYVRCITEAIIQKSARPFLSDTNTLYRGRRTNSTDHHQLALEHGFTPDAVHADVIIPDDTRKDQVCTVETDGKYIKTARIAKIFRDADSLVVVTHFKGHIMSGFGGSLKNIGMGCATREGKLAQHSDIAPFVITKKCVGCGACILVCPAKAIAVESGKSFINTKKCIGCASCIAACKQYNAIEVDWGSGSKNLQEKMIEYARAVLDNKKGRSIFFNFCLKITKECDCLAKDDPRIAPDIGILASCDPVAVDKASFDLVVKSSGSDVFKKAHPDINGNKQLSYAASLGIGCLEYDLVSLT